MTYLEKGKQVYTSEEWLFPVPASFSDLAERPDLAVEFRQKFPKISFDKFVLADGNILIQDSTSSLGPKENKKVNDLIRKELNTDKSLVTFQIVDGLTATQNLATIFPQKEWDNTLILFPGNGALSVREYLRIVKPELSRGLFIPVQRKMVGKGKFTISVNLPDQLPQGFSDILLIDDVVASGQTAETVAGSLARKLGILPPINLASWVTLENRNSSYPVGLPYFRSVFTSFIVKGNGVLRPPINSLSCLIGGAKRYDKIDENMLDRIKRIIKGELT